MWFKFPVQHQLNDNTFCHALVSSGKSQNLSLLLFFFYIIKNRTTKTHREKDTCSGSIGWLQKYMSADCSEIFLRSRLKNLEIWLQDVRDNTPVGIHHSPNLIYPWFIHDSLAPNTSATIKSLCEITENLSLFWFNKLIRFMSQLVKNCWHSFRLFCLSKISVHLWEALEQVKLTCIFFYFLFALSALLTDIFEN